MLMKYFTAVLSAVSLVAAHGYVNKVQINGKTYKGNNIGSNNRDSIIRSVTSQDPMYGVDNGGLSCGPGSKPAARMANVMPGDEIAFSWTGADGSAWPHNMGPMQTYMGYCGKGGKKDCSQVDSRTVRWFKIDDAGTRSDGYSWWQDILMGYDVARVRIPQNLAAGNYLIRHEIIALHLATEWGKAEFYAGCAQLSVGGQGTYSPSDSALMTFPGGYKQDDAGIYVPGLFDGPQNKYKFPGGGRAKLLKSGGYMSKYLNGRDEEEDVEEIEESSEKREQAEQEESVAVRNYPRHYSRVMRELVSSH